MIRVEDILPAPVEATCRECGEAAVWRLLTAERVPGRLSVSVGWTRGAVDLCTPCRRAGVRGLPLSIRIIKTAAPQERETRRIELTPAAPIAVPPAEDEGAIAPLPETTPSPPALLREESPVSKKLTPAEIAADASAEGYHVQGEPTDYTTALTITFARNGRRRSRPMVRMAEERWKPGICILEDCGKPINARGLSSACAVRARGKGVMELVGLPVKAVVVEDAPELTELLHPSKEHAALQERVKLLEAELKSAGRAIEWLYACGWPADDLGLKTMSMEAMALALAAAIDVSHRDAGGLRQVFQAAVSGEPLDPALRLAGLPLTYEAVIAWERVGQRIRREIAEGRPPEAPTELKQPRRVQEPVEVAGLERWSSDPTATLRAFPVGASGLRTAAHRAVGVCVHGHHGAPLRLTLDGRPTVVGQLATPVVVDGQVDAERVRGAVGVLLTRLEGHQIYGGEERTAWSEALIIYVGAVAEAAGLLRAVAA